MIRTGSAGPTTDALPVTTMLAYERTRVAYERTMMAWIKTGTSLISFGFAVYKFFQLDMPSVALSQSLIGPRGFGTILILIGIASLMMGMAEHRRDLAMLGSLYPNMPKSMTVISARLVAALGLAAIIAIVMRA
jgi:putative membrane protein